MSAVIKQVFGKWKLLFYIPSPPRKEELVDSRLLFFSAICDKVATLQVEGINQNTIRTRCIIRNKEERMTFRI